MSLSALGYCGNHKDNLEELTSIMMTDVNSANSNIMKRKYLIVAVYISVIIYIY